jgi:Microtubule-binding stalk of dynein motor
MQASFDAAMAQKQALEDDATATQRKMDSANALLGALAGEEARWTQQSKEFDDTIQRLTGQPDTCSCPYPLGVTSCCICMSSNRAAVASEVTRDYLAALA